jgi:hypothetical protein
MSAEEIQRELRAAVYGQNILSEGTVREWRRVLISTNFTHSSLPDYHTLGYHKFCARLIKKMITGAHKTQRMASTFTFLKRYPKDGDEFLNHILQVSSDETWILFVNVESKKQSKRGCTHIHETSREKPEQTSACEKADDKCFLEQERSADGAIHLTKNHYNVNTV